MRAQLQQRIQRYGWDGAAECYEALWGAQLAPLREQVLAQLAPRAGERVLDLACGSGELSLAVALALGPSGSLLGVDVSGEMVRIARAGAAREQVAQARFERMDAGELPLGDGALDAALCALGLMYVGDPAGTLCGVRRVLRPGGRATLAVWGARARCGWAGIFPIVQRQVASEVCPLFFSLGTGGALAQLCGACGFEAVRETRLGTVLEYPDAPSAAGAALAGGPVALAWRRFDVRTRELVTQQYLETLAPYRHGGGFRVPAEFVIVSARVPG